MYWTALSKCVAELKKIETLIVFRLFINRTVHTYVGGIQLYNLATPSLRCRDVRLKLKQSEYRMENETERETATTAANDVTQLQHRFNGLGIKLTFIMLFSFCVAYFCGGFSGIFILLSRHAMNQTTAAETTANNNLQRDAASCWLWAFEYAEFRMFLLSPLHTIKYS